jgi:hypothetical protein
MGLSSNFMAPYIYTLLVLNRQKYVKYSNFSPFTAGTNNVGNLFHMAGQVGKAVGTLVTVMTDDEGSGDDSSDKH